MGDVSEEVDTIRRFNRFYTERTGLLTDRYLGQARPLGEARLLFEIGPNGQGLGDLRERLDLDSGYLSRLLRSLERQKLVVVRPDPSDRRARLVELTTAGRRELDELDRRAASAVDELLAGLSPAQRHELVTELEKVRRLLRLAGVSVEIVDPSSDEARRCLAAYADELRERFPGGFDDAALVSPDDARGERGSFFLARERGRPIGCAVLRRLETRVGEIRHLWVQREARGMGVGRRLLTELERQSLARGYDVVRLDTHEVLTEAIELYRSSGYEEIPAYGANPYAYHWFEKRLTEST